MGNDSMLTVSFGHKRTEAEFLSNMFKAYKSDKDRFDGILDEKFECKFALCNERCDQNYLDLESRPGGFYIVHYGRASQLYFHKLRGKDLILPKLADDVRHRFQTEDRTGALLREWETMSLRNIISENLSRMGRECLEPLVSRLHDLQVSLFLE